MKLTHAVVLISTLAAGQAPNTMIFVVDKVKTVEEVHNKFNGAAATQGEYHTAPTVIAEFSKRCPSAQFTQNQSVAAFILQTQQGGSTLLNQKGDVVYVSRAHSLGNMVKDVCQFITAAK